MPEETTAPSSPPPPAPSSDNDSQSPDSRWRRFQHLMCLRLNRCFVILTYPCMILFTVISLLMVVTFCIFPTLVCMTFGVCIYYCLMEDPIPLSVLLRYMLSPDAEDNGYPNLYPLSQQRPVIQSKLIIRKVLKIDELCNNNSGDNKHNNEYPRKHPFPIQVSTDHKCLHFSEPIVMQEESTDEQPNNEGTVLEEIESSSAEPIALPPYLRPDTTTATATATATASTTATPQEPEDNSPTAAAAPTTTTTTDEEEEETTRTNTEIQSGNEENVDDDDDDDDMVEIAIGRTEDTTELEKLSNVGVEDDDDDECVITFETLSEETDDEKEQQQQMQQQQQQQQDEQEQEAQDYFGISDIRDRGTTCDICLLEFQVGDDVAWSPNLECTHAFHKDCVLDWLVRKPTCPNCRHDYLKGKQDDEV